VNTDTEVRGTTRSNRKTTNRTSRPRARNNGASTDASADMEHDMDPDMEVSSRSEAKRTLTSALKEIPNFLRLLYGLLTDRRVQPLDKWMVAGAIAYILLPMDFIPDFIPFIGEVDDLFLLVYSVQRLIKNASRAVVADHWMGDPAQLADLNLQKILLAASFFLPRRMRRRLRAIGRV
jgi:uncharacterized membrane protein YkvA (DUF1232 family)